MRPYTTLKPLGLLYLAVVAAGFLEVGIQKMQPGQGLPAPSVRRRASTASNTYLQYLVNNMTGGGYYANISLGTPPQPQLLVIDTGSSDVWVVAYDADLCTSKKLQSLAGDGCGETYNPNKSSTYQYVSSNFDISYLDGTSSEGDYFRDVFHIGGASINSLRMGYGVEIARGTGIMGISYAAQVSSTFQYPNIMEKFVSQGLIQTQSYSLYLNDVRSTAGSVLFGGVDKQKFIGSLSVLPILPVQTSITGTASFGDGSSDGSYLVLAVALDNITTTIGAHSTPQSVAFPLSSSLPAILDSGTTLSYLPGSIASSLFDAVGAYTDNDETGYTFIDCDATSLSMNLTFGGSNTNNATIVVPAAQVVLDVFSDVQDQIPANVPFERACLFGFQSLDNVPSNSVLSSNVLAVLASTSSSYALLGDTFLRSAYAVYDLTNNEIALAQANLNSTTSDIVELKSSDNGIPTLTGVKAQQTTNSGTVGTVTVTATAKSVANSLTAGSAHGPGPAVLIATAATCLLSFFGGVLVLA